MRGPSVTFLAFVLLLTIILVSYYVGTTTDTLAAGKVLQQIGFVFSGRTANGSVSGYPGGGAGQIVQPTF